MSLAGVEEWWVHLGVMAWERWVWGAQGPQLAALSQTGGRAGAQGSTAMAPLSQCPVGKRGSLLPDLRGEVTSASTVESSPM